MTYNGPWALADYDKVDMAWIMESSSVTGPNGDKRALAGGFGFSDSQNGKKPKKAAWDFIKWWTTNPDIGVEFAKISTWLPANIEAAQSTYFTEK